jgi:hypothetical protein
MISTKPAVPTGVRVEPSWPRRSLNGTGEERDRADLLDPAIAAERDRLHYLSRELTVGRADVGDDRPRLHDVDRHIARREILLAALQPQAFPELIRD